MTVRQLSAFIVNKQGKLGEVLRVLRDSNVNMLSISLADTTEYGLLRLIVDAPEEGRDALISAGYSGMLTKVLVLKVAHTAGALQNILDVVSEEGISIEYMYGLTIEGGSAYIVMKTNQIEEAEALFSKHGIMTASEEELSGKA